MNMNNMNEREVIVDTGYGTAWKENDESPWDNSLTFVQFFYRFGSRNLSYNITELDLSKAIGHDDLTKVLGSWGPSNKLRRYLEKAQKYPDTSRVRPTTTQ